MSKVIYEAQPGRYRVEVGYEQWIGSKTWIEWEQECSYSTKGDAIEEADRLARRSSCRYRVIDTIEGTDS